MQSIVEAREELESAEAALGKLRKVALDGGAGGGGGGGTGGGGLALGDSSSPVSAFSASNQLGSSTKVKGSFIKHRFTSSSSSATPAQAREALAAQLKIVADQKRAFELACFDFSIAVQNMREKEVK